MKVDGQQPLYANWLSMGVLNAYASLIFGRGMSVGLLVLGASCFDFGAGTAGVSAALASFCTTVALGYRRDVTLRGHFGFNAVLCGLALGHGHPVTPLLLIKAAVLGSVAAMLTASLSELLDTKLQLPVLALPYVLVTSLLGLVGGTGYATAHDTFAYVPDLPVHLPALVADTLRSFGSIIYAPTTAAGLLVFLAATLTSRFLAGFGVLGASLASLFFELTSSHVEKMWAQSASYNALLVSASLGCVFFVPSIASVACACVGALLTAWFTIALGPLLAHAGLPVLAWPFVLIVLGALRVLARRPAGRAPFAPVLPDANSEANLVYNRMLRLRFGLPGPVRVALPVEGTWTVTQGFNGCHTHQPPWQHALDLEITDEQGFPFRGDGVHATDYYCFDAPVSAVLAGTVVFTHSEHPDNAPGTQDLAYPYGNVIISQHGPWLYSVLAHLRQGSIMVNVGQYLRAGAIVARCGSSGRSPRPHLHFQLQANGHLGAPTLPFEVLHFALAHPETAEYVPFGVPQEGTCIAGAQIAKVPELSLLTAGAEASLARGQVAERRLRSEVSPVGVRSLYDTVSGERLFFSTLDGVATFTTLCARAQSPLAVLALALPRVPPFGGNVVVREKIPPEWLFARWLQRINALFQLFAIGIQVNGSTRAARTDRSLTAVTDLEIRWLGRVWHRYSASVVLEGTTITSLTLCRGARTAFDAASAATGARVPRRRSRGKDSVFRRSLAFLTIPVIFGVAASSMLLTSKPSIARPVPSSLAESYRYEAAGDLRRAIDATERAAEESPLVYFVRLRLAYLKFRAKFYRESADDYAEAARLAPEAVEPLLGELGALALMERHERSILVADAILELDPKSYVGRSRRAWALYQLSRYAEAVDEYATVVRLYPGDIEMRLGLGYALSGAKRPVEAGIEFREVLKRMPTNSRARVALGLP